MIMLKRVIGSVTIQSRHHTKFTCLSEKPLLLSIMSPSRRKMVWFLADSRGRTSLEKIVISSNPQNP